ncbi:GNAT family N-acetyltransferase [Mesorhizobium sp. M7A.F.Ca.US.014.04.1.1]|uniref:GNAT family N-acetyltransferase n=1 Tax=Mesorhizobium TaxID=68287 RepID=UPI0007A95C74|nr:MULTISPECIES: GNAT family N-acetyltransferase [Mesorhizobium]AMX91964.1 acetyltransferase [Mesorhizobium ciceri]MDF3210574.1 GNAT family N-acetyltransferase [Mesorhizobium sp. LMG15046]MDF3231602.1 GNAT family N-acetyltransferase [Mesorhizobium sp. DSM 30133]RUU16238.1 GNAT family N-acetyltransferase [Mesorhizobium sp. Primo-B]RUU36304.1 GNAT family N-acetyltransferase [Mesorhizobium sp. Primo-A]
MNGPAVFRMQQAHRIEIATSPERLAEIAPAWAALWQRAGGLVFQHPDWISAWWHTTPHQDRRGLRIGLVWSGERLEAVIALATFWRSGIRMLEWAAKDHCDYGDVLLAPDAEPQILPQLWQHILDDSGFDLAYLNRLLPDARFRTLLGPAAPGQGSILQPSHRSEVSYRVSSAGQRGAQWFESQSKKTRQNYRRGYKFMEEGGALRFRLMDAHEAREPVLERVAALKRLWLAKHGRVSDLFDEGSPALPALISVLAGLGLLRIFVLEREDEIIAISINFEQHGTMMAFVTTYDPAFERASPGMVLMMDYIQWSFDRGLTTIDFLCGGEDFKRRFATHSVILSSVVGGRNLRGRLAALADRARHAAQSWRPEKPAQQAELVAAE